MKSEKAKPLFPKDRTLNVQRRSEIVGAMLEFVYRTDPDFFSQSQEKIAKRLKLSRADVSRLLRGDIERFTIDRLLTIAARLKVRMQIRSFGEDFSAHSTLYPVATAFGSQPAGRLKRTMHRALATDGRTNYLT